MVDLGYSVTEFPTILGFNASGTVVQLGDGVTDLAVGDRVGIIFFDVIRRIPPNLMIDKGHGILLP